LCLFVERLNTESASEDERRPPEIIALDGVVSLRIRHNLVMTAAGVRPDSLIFEPLPGRPVPTVRLTVDDDDIVVRVNGEIVGSTCELHVRDVLKCVGEPVALHLSMIQRPYVGPVATEHVGRACAVCKAPIDDPPTAVVLECVACGAVLHEHAPDLGSTGEFLECAKTVTACPVCETRLQREESYVYVPGLAG